MFSYLRPHRRTPSTPTSPLPEQAHSWEPPLLHPADNSHPYAPRRLDATNLPERRRALSASPPSLPPIARVSSTPEYEQPSFNGLNGAAKQPEIRSYEHSPVTRASVSNHYTSDSQPLADPQTSQWAGIRSEHERPQFSHTIQSPPGQAGSSFQHGAGQSQGGGRLPFVTSSDIQTTYVPTGRRPNGVRMPTPPPAPPTNLVSTFDASQKSSSKTRLNLLNPMSLLARRRTSHPVPQLLPVPVVAYPSQRSPSDYDPRIRGTKVHDFSAPRPKRNTSYDNVSDLKTSSARPPQPLSHDGRSGRLPEDGELSPWSTGRHTPVFKEDFEEQQYPAAGPHVRKANDFSDLSLPRPPYAREAQLSRDLPSTSNGSERDVSAAEQAKESADKETVPDARSPGTTNDDVGDAMSKLQMQRLSNSNPRKQSKHQTSSSTSQGRNVSGISDKESISGLLKHMKSNSSRFSFDMIGAASQEKLLEDRHREKALRNQSASPEPESRAYDDEEDDFDYDNMMDDDGLEERIPGVNADLEDEEDFPQQNGIAGFTFHSMNTSAIPSPMSPYGQGMVSTPRDAEGNVIGFAMTKESPSMVLDQTPEPAKQHDSYTTHNQITEKNMAVKEGHSGLGLQGIDFGDHQAPQTEHLLPAHQLSNALQDSRQKYDLEEDDMYFDDGLIAHPDDGMEGPEFDESIFDNDDTDQYGRPLRPLSSLPTLYSPLVHTNPESLGASKRLSAEEKRTSHSNDQNTISPQDRAESPKDSFSQQQTLSPPILQPTASLTQGTIGAYQSALAAAAYAAAANGRFRRDSSPGAQFDDEDIPNPDEDQLYSPSLEDDFDYDDAYEDDPIIAEANAEALAYDSDGFYSQEFGFYSAPAGAEALYANGGFFGPRGVEGVNRNQSTRTREPNLTPITERSEYSNRNSIMSLPLSHGGTSIGSPGLGAVGSPGLAQLAGMLSEQDDSNMSFSALLKLRSRAWGGSQASLPTSGRGSPSMSFAADENSSSSPAPVPHLSPWTQNQMSSSPAFTSTQWQQTQPSSSPAETRMPMPAPTAFGHGRKGSTFSLTSDGADSEATSSNASPKMQFSHPARPQLQAQFLPAPLRPVSRVSPSPPGAPRDSLNHRPNSSPPSDISPASGLVSTTMSQFDAEVGFFAKGAEMRKHRHTGSSDSISYMKEDDPVAGERWVLERRRTAETGEVEVLGREVVSGGRI